MQKESKDNEHNMGILFKVIIVFPFYSPDTMPRGTGKSISLPMKDAECYNSTKQVISFYIFFNVTSYNSTGLLNYWAQGCVIHSG